MMNTTQSDTESTDAQELQIISVNEFKAGNAVKLMRGSQEIIEEAVDQDPIMSRSLKLKNF